MVKTNFIVLTFCLQTLLLISQGGWKKQYYPLGSFANKCGSVIETPGGNLIMIGVTYDTLNGYGFNRLTLIGSDNIGNNLWRKDYGNYKFEYLNTTGQNSVIQDVNGFYLTICVKDSNNKWPSALIRFDYNGDTLWQKKYYSNQANVNLYLVGLNKGIDNSLLMCGSYEDFNLSQSPCVLLKADLQGNEIWRSVINKPIPNLNPGNSILQDSASKRIIVVGYQYIGNATTWSSYSNILILDSLGNKIHQNSFNNAGGGGFASVIQLNDGNFLSGGQWFEQQVGATTKFKSFLVKFDTAGTVLWSKKYDRVSPYNYMFLFKEMSNHDIVVIGELDTMQNYLTQPVVKIRLSLVDSLGILKWQKYIGSSHSHAFSEGATSMRKTSDGGFILSSYFPYMQSPQPFSIIKTDSLGCDTIEEFCLNPVNVNEYYTKEGFSFEMFPNPANEYVRFVISTPLSAGFAIRVIDLQGRDVHITEFDKTGTIEVNTKNFSAGVYLVRILSDGKAIETKKLVITR